MMNLDADNSLILGLAGGLIIFGVILYLAIIVSSFGGGDRDI